MLCTTCINRRQADSLRAAFQYALTQPGVQDRPLNLYAVINFDHAEPWEVSNAFQKLRRNHFTRWLRHHTGGRVLPYYIWCLECVSRPGIGQNRHANFVIHIPRSLQTAFRANLPLWLAQVTGVVRVGNNAVHVQPVDDRHGGLAGLQKYLLKGVEPAIAARYGVHAEQQGEIFGKRAGVSETLGPASRARSSSSGRIWRAAA